MKVALFVHCFFPGHFYGTETYTLQVAKNLRAQGHDATVVTAIFAGEPPRDALITRYEFEGVPVIAIDKNKVPHRNIRETYWQESMRDPLRAVLRELGCDIVHVTHLISHTAVLLEEAKALNIPVVATLTDFFGFCYNNKLEAAGGSLCMGPDRYRVNCIACHLKASANAPHASRTARALSHPLLRTATAMGMRAGLAFRFAPGSRYHAVAADVSARPNILFDAYQAYDAMIAPTTFLRDAYVQNGFDPAQLHLSRFGVDVARTPKQPWPENAPLTVGYIGQLAAHKGVDLLLQAAGRMPQEHLHIKIHGPENQDPTYMARLRELAPPNTEFCGTFPSDRMASVLAGMDLLAIPSTWYENSPLALLSALATHTPVLVSDVQGLTEFVDEGRNGWSFKRGDLDHLTTVLGKLVHEPRLVRQAVAHTAYDRDPAAMTRDVVDVYGRALAAKTQPTLGPNVSGAQLPMNFERYRDGIGGDIDAWIDFNRTGAFGTSGGLDLVAPFPPTTLMQNTSGLVEPADFASHGCDILQALKAASLKPLSEYGEILDFGVGVGRLARMFKGMHGNYTGIDVDKRHVAWVHSALDYVNAIATEPRQPLPFPDNKFDCVISISVFTHMNEQDQFRYLAEIARVTQPGAMVFLTMHGARALVRAETETQIFEMLSVPRAAVNTTRQLFPAPGFNFILQQGHLTSRDYDYGITFTGEDYIRREWSK